MHGDTDKLTCTRSKKRKHASESFPPKRPITAPDDPTEILLGMAMTLRTDDPTALTKYMVNHVGDPHSLSKKAPVSNCTAILHSK